MLMPCFALICWHYQHFRICALIGPDRGPDEPQNERKKSAKRAQKSANERKLKKKSARFDLRSRGI